jgi:cation diffusion facilitator CzcD-associated flavoprotein CzcO
MSDSSNSLPPAALDQESVKQKYREERDKRLRPDGNGQYLRLTDQLSHYLDDPYIPVTEREPKTDHVTFAFIGGGFGGLVTGARLVEAGIKDVRIIDKAGDFGGTWYWNRYPGAQCDTASFVYLPLLEETGHMPSEKYTHAPEILEHSQRIGKHYGLYENALFHTEVKELAWDEETGHWLVKTNRGDAFTAQYVGWGNGGLHTPKLPGIPGLSTFQGHSFHTSRWDYDYTGGDALGAPMGRLADKRVAIIGTGATAVQCVPRLAGACKELYVLQRTPSSVDVRNNHPTDPEWFASIATEGWQQRWLENFTANQTEAGAKEDLVQDGWTDTQKSTRARINSLPPEQRNAQNMMKAAAAADLEKMNQIRSRVDSIVRDNETAQNLKAWYGQFCKRPCFHDEYLQAFNVPGTHLVDTDGKGVERITEKSVVAAGKAYEVDCIIYSSGFELVGEFTRRMGFDVVGRDGLKLSDYWADGMHSKHGIHVHGFPNAFMVQPTQGANLVSNIPHNLTEAGKTIAIIVRHAQDQGCNRVEVSKESEQAWYDLLTSVDARKVSSPDCTPGYYNNEGQEMPEARTFVGYPKGPTAYFEYLEDWRNSGDFEGIEFR